MISNHHISIVIATLGNLQEIYFINLESQSTKGIRIRYISFALSDPSMLQLHYLLGFNQRLQSPASATYLCCLVDGKVELDASTLIVT
jgi:hypothetical protein